MMYVFVNGIDVREQYKILLRSLLLIAFAVSCINRDVDNQKVTHIESLDTVSHNDSSSLLRESIAMAEYYVIDGRVLEMHIMNTSNSAIALVPTLYTIAEMKHGVIKATSTSIGAIVYWDTMSSARVVFDLLEPWPRFQPNLPMTVVEIPKGRSVKIQFPLDTSVMAHAATSLLKVELECLPAWEITSDFKDQIDSTYVVTGREVYSMCRRDNATGELPYEVCNTKNWRVMSKKMFDWLCSEVRHVEAKAVQGSRR